MISNTVVMTTRKLVSQWPRGVLGISSDGDDRRILLGLKFSIPGFSWVRKFGLGSLIWVGIFLGVLKRIGSALAA